MILTEEQLYCLNATCDDYENLTSIIGDIALSTNKEIDVEQAKLLLKQLLELKLLDIFTYDIVSQEYKKQTGSIGAIDSYWFYITDKGRSMLDEQWQE